ncbi:cysteine hydrolase family protein [Dyella flagellata]|uniref:cysteine hydrolase family protein n=1 Tax=Dyella flagellata TaxID=1867833 RepID=UPI0024E0EFD0|nr:isochorismatase family protein [Dyella flagellata]
MVDVQAGVVASAWQRDRVVANVAVAVDRARAAGVPIVWVQHNDDELRRDTPEWQWVPELKPLESESRIHKQFNSSFEETPLLSLLEHHGVSHIVLAGAASNWCIRATAYAALERGFDLTLVEDAHTTGDMELEPGRLVAAQSIVEDLNAVMRWISYPGRKSGVVHAAELSFGSPAVAA